jgi:hypothetical protein
MDNSTHLVEMFDHVKNYDLVKVTTFKDSGKYYHSFVLKVTLLDKHNDQWYNVVEEVRRFKRTAKLQSELTWVLTCETRDDWYPVQIKL